MIGQNNLVFVLRHSIEIRSIDQVNQLSIFHKRFPAHGLEWLRVARMVISVWILRPNWKLLFFLSLLAYGTLILSPGMGIFHRSAGFSECLQKTGRITHSVEPSFYSCGKSFVVVYFCF